MLACGTTRQVVDNVVQRNMGIAESCSGSNSTCMCTHLQCHTFYLCPSLYSAHPLSLQIPSRTQFNFAENATGFLIQEACLGNTKLEYSPPEVRKMTFISRHNTYATTLDHK